MVESNSNRFRDPSVFKTVQGPAPITLHICHIEAHSAPLTTLFLSIQDAPGINPADPLGCLYLSIQIESVFLYGWGTLNRTRTYGFKVRSTTTMLYPNRN
jgi:hypothetical protein